MLLHHTLSLSLSLSIYLSIYLYLLFVKNWCYHRNAVTISFFYNPPTLFQDVPPTPPAIIPAIWLSSFFFFASNILRKKNSSYYCPSPQVNFNKMLITIHEFRSCESKSWSSLLDYRKCSLVNLFSPTK